MVPANVTLTDRTPRRPTRRPPSVFTSASRRPPSIVDDLESADADLFDPLQAARHLGISRERLDELVSAHRITYYERGSAILFDVADLDAWRHKSPVHERPRRGRLGV